MPEGQRDSAFKGADVNVVEELGCLGEKYADEVVRPRQKRVRIAVGLLNFVRVRKPL